MKLKSRRALGPSVRIAGAGALLAAILVAPPAFAAQISVATSAELIAAIETANAAPGPDTIRITAAITLEADLPAITDDLVITGGGSIDGGGLFSGVRAKDTAELTVSDLTFTNTRGNTIDIENVDRATVTDVIITGSTGSGIYTYSPGTNHVEIDNATVSGTRYGGANVRLFNNATAALSGVHVVDSGRLEITSTPRETGGLTVVAMHNSRAELTNISHTETQADRGAGERFPGLVANASDNARITITGATANGPSIGAQLTTADNADLELTDLAVPRSGFAAVDVEAGENSRATITSATVEESATDGVTIESSDSAVVRLTDTRVAQAGRTALNMQAYDTASIDAATLAVGHAGQVGLDVSAYDSAAIDAQGVVVENSEGDAVSASAWEDSGVDLGDVVVRAAGRDGVVLMVRDTGAATLDGAEITTTADHGLVIMADDDASVDVEDITVSATGRLGMDIGASDVTSVSIDGFHVSDAEGVAAEITDGAALTMQRGLIEDAGVEGVLFIGTYEPGAQRTSAVLTDVAVLDAPYDAVSVINVGATELDSVTIARSNNLGLVYATSSSESTLNVVNSTVADQPNLMYIHSTSDNGSPLILIDSSTFAGAGSNVLGIGGTGDVPVIEVRNSILSGTYGDAHTAGIIDSVTSEYSLWNGVGAELEGFLTGSGNLINEDPRLEPLADNGGGTPTRLLAEGSPAIDAGDPDAGTYAPVHDQRGGERIIGIIDMGATEVGTLDEDGGDTDGTDDDGSDDDGTDDDGSDDDGTDDDGTDDDGTDDDGTDDDGTDGDSTDGDSDGTDDDVTDGDSTDGDSDGTDDSTDDDGSDGLDHLDELPSGLADAGPGQVVWFGLAAIGLIVLGFVLSRMRVA